MAKYDSDSSSEGDDDYTTTDVVLGYIESSGDEVSHVGGHPTWLDTKVTPTASFAKCKVCKGYMSLLLQLDADLAKHFPNDSRRLQVWTCRKKACARKPGSICAFREVKKGKSTKTPKAKDVAPPQRAPGIGLGNALFGGSTPPAGGNFNPFSTTAQPSTEATNPFSTSESSKPLGVSASLAEQSSSQPQHLVETFADKLKINTAQDRPVSEPWPQMEEFPEPFAHQYLDAGPEELDLTSDQSASSLAESSNTKYDIEDPTSSQAETDTFESDLDKTFQKFSDIVGQNPKQVLRYEFKGQPLLYSGTDGVASRFVVPHGKSGAIRGIPRCERCGSQRTFEMQLTPYLIFEIEKDEAIDIDNGMDWGTIIVGTCVNNCGDEESISFREEWVGVQWEERVSRK